MTRVWIPAAPLFLASVGCTISVTLLWGTNLFLWLLGLRQFAVEPGVKDFLQVALVLLIGWTISLVLWLTGLAVLRNHSWAKIMAGLLLPLFAWGGAWCLQESISAGRGFAGLACLALIASGLIIELWVFAAAWALLSLEWKSFFKWH